ncbi:MAG: hypothetical protein ICV73_24355, partial [Acetobacteraceae bacterium]|nr:hypothetical protein [Acetobacteraceae bacterium]
MIRDPVDQHDGGHAPWRRPIRPADPINRIWYDFLGWCEQHRLSLPTIEPVHVAAYVEQLLQTGLPRNPGESPAPLAAPSVKQQLAAVRMLFDWFVIG